MFCWVPIHFYLAIFMTCVFFFLTLIFYYKNLWKRFPKGFFLFWVQYVKVFHLFRGSSMGGGSVLRHATTASNLSLWPCVPFSLS